MTALASSVSPVPPAVPASHHAITVEAADGVTLGARYYPPANPAAARGAVFLVSAMGVSQTFYAAFAKWLARNDFHALTFDYRGVGESRKGSLRAVDADIVTWAEKDTQAALHALESLAPGLPITWVGHSLGGQILPFVRDRGRVAKIITVATGSGYWRENAPPLKNRVWLFWFAAVPVTTPLFGYFPGRALGMVGDLPRGVIRQWRKWCLDPEYAVGAEGPFVRDLFASVKTPLLAFSFTDDEMMSAENIASIHSFYSGAERTMRRIHPRALGVEKVGHFGFFRDNLTDALWEGEVLPELAVL